MNCGETRFVMTIEAARPGRFSRGGLSPHHQTAQPSSRRVIGFHLGRRSPGFTSLRAFCVVIHGVVHAVAHGYDGTLRLNSSYVQTALDAWKPPA